MPFWWELQNCHWDHMLGWVRGQREGRRAPEPGLCPTSRSMRFTLLTVLSSCEAGAHLLHLLCRCKLALHTERQRYNPRNAFLSNFITMWHHRMRSPKPRWLSLLLRDRVCLSVCLSFCCRLLLLGPDKQHDMTSNTRENDGIEGRGACMSQSRWGNSRPSSVLQQTLYTQEEHAVCD